MGGTEIHRGGGGAVRMEDGEGRKTGFMGRALLAGAVMLGSCSPNVVIRNSVYDPNADARPDAGCTTISSCAQKEMLLREPGNKAGPSEAGIGGATVKLLRVEDSGSTKAAVLSLSGCGKSAEGKFTPGSSMALTFGRDTFKVTLQALEYDSAGILVKVSVQPLVDCPVDAGIPNIDVIRDSRRGERK